MESRASRFSTPRLIVIGLALAAVVIAAILLIPRRTAADDPRYAQARRDMVSDLRGLAMMEASLHRVTGKYTDDPTQAGQISTVGVNPPTVALADSGWAAVITHQRATGFRCGIGVYTKNPLSRWAKSGEIVCK
jgi:hypothetical protein